MNYLHEYHAGNFADVTKHSLLLLLLEALCRKDTPFCYLETHAGAGGYNLQSPAALRTGEFREGIARLLASPGLPPLLTHYRQLVSACNPPHRLYHYPGSPQLAAAVLRPQDRLVLMESEAEVYAQLRRETAGDKRIAVHHREGYDGIRALLPPPEKRGLLFIDPPYEAQKREFTTVLSALQTAHQRWATGIVAVWYPIKQRADIQVFHRQLQASGLRKLLILELCIYPDDTPLTLNGSGLLVMNPPWQFAQAAAEVLTSLHPLLRQHPQTRWTVQELVGE